MKFCVLWIPYFRVHALRRSDATLAGRAVALISGEGRKATIAEASPEAKGVTPGLAVTLAMAQCPGIVLRPRDPTAEVEAQRILIASSFSLSPRVETTAGGCCTVDLQGADAVKTEIQMRFCIRELTKAGLPARIGAAATPLLANMAAQCAEPLLIVTDTRSFLIPLPLTFAAPTPTQTEILSGWGIRTLGDLTALSKADVAQRLGTEGVALWERAAGETTSVLRLVEPSQTFEAEWEYEPPVESIEPLFFRLRAFAERIALELRAAQLVAEELTLTLFLEDETDYRRNFRLPEANTDLDSWLRVLNSHLETVRTAARVVRVRLVAKPIRAPEKQGGLFDTGLRDPAAFWENLARVSAIVGEGRVGTPIIADTHKPDAFILVKPTELVPAPAEPIIHPPRGLRLRRFRPPWPIHVELAGERPTTINSAQIRGAICTVAGPWRVSGEWWRPKAWAVETWHVELSEGGVYQLAHTDDGWRVEGVLD